MITRPLLAVIAGRGHFFVVWGLQLTSRCTAALVATPTNDQTHDGLCDFAIAVTKWFDFKEAIWPFVTGRGASKKILGELK